MRIDVERTGEFYDLSNRKLADMKKIAIIESAILDPQALSNISELLTEHYGLEIVMFNDGAVTVFPVGTDGIPDRKAKTPVDDSTLVVFSGEEPKSKDEAVDDGNLLAFSKVVARMQGDNLVLVANNIIKDGEASFVRIIDSAGIPKLQLSVAPTKVTKGGTLSIQIDPKIFMSPTPVAAG